ncbi:hypothetical protein O0I10_013160 [Lichtheimia ornata]|uniref:Uncharacterized protein n=1 Tax=Lichtheimia ornata TaxID=688661 RepID=A0AAD7UPT6_9FUNG|nr:uncharacterized protein O0I10_013160 [Lichtheimia ornata]KAJ8651339.1 hypothetical protein O0I10_013160 [Lichtheimia ornata]
MAYRDWIHRKRRIDDDQEEDARQVEAILRRMEARGEERRQIVPNMADHPTTYRDVINNEQQFERYLEAIRDDTTALEYFEDVLHERRRRRIKG